jgi:hypothetical protein
MFAIPILVLAAACGRGRFEAQPPSDAAADSAPDIAPDTAPPILACSATRFAVPPAIKGFTAVGTQQGYDVFVVDATNLWGYSYRFDTESRTTAELVAGTSGVIVDANASPTGPLGSIAVGDDVLVAMTYGQPVATGSQLIPLAPNLASLGKQLTLDGSIATTGPLALARNGTLVFASQPALDKIDLQIVSPLRLDVPGASPVGVSEGGAPLNNPTVMAARAGFAVVWAAGISGSPIALHAQLFDAQLKPQTLMPVALPITQTASTNIEFPRAAYAQAADRYLLAWHEKINSVDQVWYSVRNDALGEIVSAKLAERGVRPVIAAGKDDFLVVWEDGSMQPKLSAARIAMDGTVSYVPVPDSGGTAAGWNLVVHNGQPALVWIEAGGTGSNLRLDPLCP